MKHHEILEALEKGEEIVETLMKARKGRRLVYIRLYDLNGKNLLMHEFESIKHLIEKSENSQSPFTHYKLKTI